MARQVTVVLRHLGRGMSHEFRKGLDVHAVDDRLRAKLVPDAIQCHVFRHSGNDSESPSPQPKTRPVPRMPLHVEEYVFRAGWLLSFDPPEQLGNPRNDLDDSWPGRPLCSSRLVVLEYDDVVVNIQVCPLQR